jgi:hypothetical protein
MVMATTWSAEGREFSGNQVALRLLASAVKMLVEVSGAVGKGDGHDREGEVCHGTKSIAGEYPEAPGVRGNMGGERYLHGKISDFLSALRGEVRFWVKRHGPDLSSKAKKYPHTGARSKSEQRGERACGLSILPNRQHITEYNF